MIQDIGNRKIINHYEKRQPEAGDRMVVIEDGKLLCQLEEGKVIFPLISQTCRPEEYEYLFSVDDDHYFLSSRGEAEPGFSFESIRGLNRAQVSDNESMLATYTAYHLWRWYQDNRFCGRCGAPTISKQDERARVCPECGNIIYPRINPAVIVGVTNGERILITRYATGFRHNALVAGFTEIGETLEQTVEREVMEEAGLKVKNIRYYKSQPWGIAQDILAGFYCDVDGDDTIKMDPSELKYAEWVERKDIELQPTNFSLTNEMMRMFRDGKR